MTQQVRREEEKMINYDEELKNFEPCLDVDDVENAIYDRELIDVIDLLKEMLQDINSSKET